MLLMFSHAVKKKLILNLISITVQLSESTKQSDSSNDLIKNLQSK